MGQAINSRSADVGVNRCHGLISAAVAAGFSKAWRRCPRRFRQKKTAAGEVTPPAAGCTLAHPRPGYPSLGCVPAEPNSVSPDGMSLAQYAYRINVHLATCAMPPKILRRQPHLASGLTATHRKPGRTLFSPRHPRSIRSDIMHDCNSFSPGAVVLFDVHPTILANGDRVRTLLQCFRELASSR